MASLQKNVASQNFTFAMINASTGGADTGLTVTVYVTKDNGAQATGSGTVTEAGHGQYNYAPTQAETNATDVGFICTATGAIPVNLDFHTDVVDANGFLEVGVQAVNGVTLAAQALAQSAQSICWGTCTTGSTTTSVNVGTLNNPSTLTDSGQLIGRTIIFLGNTTSGHMQAQASNITASTTGATPTLTVTALTNAPANNDVFVIL